MITSGFFISYIGLQLRDSLYGWYGRYGFLEESITFFKSDHGEACSFWTNITSQRLSSELANPPSQISGFIRNSEAVYVCNTSVIRLEAKVRDSTWPACRSVQIYGPGDLHLLDELVLRESVVEYCTEYFVAYGAETGEERLAPFFLEGIFSGSGWTMWLDA